MAEFSWILPAAATSTSPTPVSPDLSGADELGDLRLTWSNDTGDADLSLTGTDLSTDRGIATAMALSLFPDRRAEAGDVPPSGDPSDRRGWWADQFAEVEGDHIGSRLWLLARAKRTNETVLLAKQYVNEALQWMLDDRVVSGIDVTTETADAALLFAVALSRPGRDPVTFRFAHVWDHVQEDL